MAEVLVEHKADTAWVTLHRPDVRNALSRDLCKQLTEIAVNLDAHDSVRAVVLTGSGDKAFCAGADLKERKGTSADEARPFINAIATAVETWGEIRKPTICALNGSAYGGGLELAMACDLRVMVDSAEVGLTEVRLGIIPGAGGTQRLPRLIGEARAKELLLLGRRIPATRALEIGLVHQMVSSAKLRTAVDALIAELAGCAPIATMMAKSAVQRGYGKPLTEALSIERECYDVTLFSEDRDEGLAAFAASRPPRYNGR